MKIINSQHTLLIRLFGLFTVMPIFAVIDGFGKEQPIAQSMADTARELIASIDHKKKG